ncbi:MAG: SOS response-associated peptidase [Cyclobacteriaceae bacterium]|nr:SOS response-associated peptidase [Cyclobacteriaceae bacterium]
MIERYSIHATNQQLKERFKIEETPGYQPRYNAGPSHLLPVITHQSPQGFSYFYWGAPQQFLKNKTVAERIVNTRAELIAEKPVLKKTMMRFRCLIPATGFYAWKKVGKKTSIPWFFVPNNKTIWSFAGLWEEYDDPEGNAYHTFSIITVPANETVAEVTERMPVILTPQEESVWLDKKSTEDILLGLMRSTSATELTGYTVSPAINSLTHESASLIAPAPAADQFGNLTLFN